MAQETGGTSRRAAEDKRPADRFDEVSRSGRVGAHRVAARPRYFWQFLIAGLLGFAVITGIGVALVNYAGNTGKLPSGNPSTSSQSGGGKGAAAAPKLDPAATIAVLNGTDTPNLAGALDALITENKWGDMVFSGTASAEVKITTIFYSDPADEAAAAGLAAELGGPAAFLSKDYDEYSARLVVLLGDDYAGPGRDEAEQMTAERTAANAVGDAGDDGVAVTDVDGAGDAAVADAGADPAADAGIDGAADAGAPGVGVDGAGSADTGAAGAAEGTLDGAADASGALG